MDRRGFLKTTTAAAAALGTFNAMDSRSLYGGPDEFPVSAGEPWYRRALRWGQTNITEKDPASYDIAWWRKYWKETGINGVIINAGGIVAYYPSMVPLHRQAEFLTGKDLFGDLCRAAHEDGLAVFARMDSNRAHEEFYKTHPDWFAINSEGEPYRAGDLYITCINGPYYSEHIPAILTEIATVYKPEGFTDNSWSGLGRDSICYCSNCKKEFRSLTGLDLPSKTDWDNKSYREWIKWSYSRRLAIWDLNNRVTRKAGGNDCIWSGMNSGSVVWQSESFRDYREICKRAEIIMLDSQARNDQTGFQQNADTGKLIHGLLGWDKLIPESMAMYQAGRPTFRMAAKPLQEATMWMTEGLAGGIQPWWHFVGAAHEDRRIYRTPLELFAWHRQNEYFLTKRRPVASVGLVWSQTNTDFFGRDEADYLTAMPYFGIMQALLRARIPYIPVHADDIGREAPGLSLLILPNLGSMSTTQLAAVSKFVHSGGNLLATGQTSLYDEWGDLRNDFGLAELFGTHTCRENDTAPRTGRSPGTEETVHSYLRLLPATASASDGPKGAVWRKAGGERHPVLAGFTDTDILEFGGILEPLVTAPASRVLMTYIPPFPVYPPEKAWMREPETGIPGLILNELPGCGKVVFMPADVDRQFFRYNLPDHGNLLENIIRWASGNQIPLGVNCPGLLDCNLYKKENHTILHLVNLTGPAAWRQPADQFIAVGPAQIRIRTDCAEGQVPVKLLAAGKEITGKVKQGWCEFEIASITDHEVAVFGH